MVIIHLMRPQIPSHKVIIISSFHCNSILGNFFLCINVLEENLPPYVQKYPISLENWTKLIWREMWDFVCSKNLTPSLLASSGGAGHIRGVGWQLSPRGELRSQRWRRGHRHRQSTKRGQRKWPQTFSGLISIQ